MKNKSPAEIGRLLTLSQARDELNCGRTKLYQLHQRGLLEFVKFDKQTRVTERSIKKLVHDLIKTKTIAPKTDGNADSTGTD